MNRLWSSLVWILSSWSVLFEQPQSWSKLKASGRLSLKLQSVVMPHVCFSDHLLPEIHSTKRSGLDPSLHWGKTFYYWKIWHFWRAESSETTTAQPQRLFFSKLKSVLGRDPEFNQIELRVRQKLFFWRASFFWKFRKRRVRIGLFLLKFRATDSWHLQHQSLTRLQKEDNAFTRLTRAPLSFFLKNIGQQPFELSYHAWCDTQNACMEVFVRRRSKNSWVFFPARRHPLSSRWNPDSPLLSFSIIQSSMA